MSDPSADETTKADRSESAPRLRFVTARPDTTQGKREARAAIRAHASQASWAKIREHGKQSRRKTNSLIESNQPTRLEQQRRPSYAGGQASTELVSSYSNDRPGNHRSFGRASAGSQLFVPSPAVRQNFLESIGIPSPLRTIGAGDIDPFTSYPSQLPKEVAAPIISQSKPGTIPTCWIAAQAIHIHVFMQVLTSLGAVLTVNNFFNIIFLPDPERPEQSIVRHWISWYMNDSILFHAHCFAQLARLSVAENELKSINRRAYWYCYSEIVREVNRRFNEPSERCSDALIHVVQALAFHGDATLDDADIPRSPAQGPFNSMQGLDTYTGRLNPVNMHVNGLAKMLSMRGGITDIEFPGLAAILS